MKLPLPKLFGQKEQREYFLALLLRDEKTTAVIFEELAGKMRVIGEHEVYFSTSIEDIHEEEFLQALDEAISTAESSLPDNVETRKTIFGVKETWVEGVKIKREYLTRLKKASDELLLTPVGFLVIHEAIAHFLQQEEGAPISAILVEVGKKDVTLSLLRGGRIEETRHAVVENSLAQTVDKTLHYLSNTPVLPARIVIFDGDKDNETINQQFIAHAWSMSLPFLHMPTITMLPKGFEAKAVLFGAAKQMGFGVLSETPRKASNTQESNKQEIKETEKTVPIQKVPQQKEEKKEPEPFQEDFGFIGEDIALMPTQEEEKKGKPIETPEKELVSEETGVSEPKETINASTRVITRLTSFLGTISSLFNSLFTRITSLMLHGKHLHTDTFPKQSVLRKPSPFLILRKKPLMLGIILLLLLLAALILPFFLTKATITLHIQTTPISQKSDVTFTTAGATDFAHHVIQADSIAITENTTATTKATGTKEVGQKARGSVTLYNSSLTQGQSIGQGTTITSSNGLTFTLDSQVSVASASGDASSIQSSTATVSVTATDIGKESNLPSGTKFTVAGFDPATVIAKNDSAFSGGSKDTITVVSPQDQNTLIGQVIKSAEDKAKQDLMQKTSQDVSLIPFFTNESVTKKTLSKQVGDEASSVNLDATISYTALSVKKSVLQEAAKNLLQPSISSGMTVSQSGITYSLDNLNQDKNNTITGSLTAHAAIVPDVDTKTLTADMQGKSINEAKTLLSQKPHVATVTVILSPHIPLVSRSLPNDPKRITIVLLYDD